MMPTADHVRRLFAYDKETGILTWKVRPVNSVHIGDQAGSLQRNGYRKVKIQQRRYFEHRVAWLIVTGDWPSNEVDHINGVRSDNRWANLRGATHRENMWNTQKTSNEFPGATYHKRIGKYQARISTPEGRKQLGYFDTPEEASNAYIEAARKYHGEFAKV